MFNPEFQSISLPLNYQPRRPAHFKVKRIVLAKGSLATPERRKFIERILPLYPEAEIEEQLNTPHNRITPVSDDPLARHQAGKETLVFAIHQSAVRKSEEKNNTCPNYWHFSPYSFCPYGCKYCYLAGTRSIYLSPSVKIFVNLPEMLGKIDRQARKLDEPTAFYLGKLQDALALDPLTGYSQVMIPFFANHPFARLTLLTKSADVSNLLELEHNRQTILSWSLNPSEVWEDFEANVPSPNERIKAMQQCAAVGYPVRAVLMPMLPVDNWPEIYARFVKELLEAVPLARLTMAGICSYPDAKRLMENKLGQDNAICQQMALSNPSATNGSETEMVDSEAQPRECQRGLPRREADYRRRFASETRIKMYQMVIKLARQIRPDLDLALCLEEDRVLGAVGLTESSGRCNCVL